MRNTMKSSVEPASSAGRALPLLLVVMALGAAAGLLILRRPAVPQAAPPPAPAVTASESEPTAPAVPAAPSAVESPPGDAAPGPGPSEPGPAAPPEPKAAATTTPPKPARAGQKEPVKDELARVALIFVGFDPEAEAYWYAAINDNNLSAHERQDLIEDLNEEGFADPRNPAPEELPLIVSRLSLIEEVAADAMDQVNADAFAEAYKDLVNMRNRLLGR